MQDVTAIILTIIDRLDKESQLKEAVLRRTRLTALTRRVRWVEKKTNDGRTDCGPDHQITAHPPHEMKTHVD